MKKIYFTMLLSGLAGWMLTAPVRAEEKLERGKDRIDLPAMGPGLWVHSLFQSNMIIQRDKPIRVWGWAEPGEKVTVTFSGNTQAATAAADRSWKVELPAMPVNTEPQKMTIQGKEKTVELENILLGDIWLMAGQSNMEFPLAKVDAGQLEIISANFKNMRLLKVPQIVGPETQTSFPRFYRWSGWDGRHFRQGYWDVVSPATAADLPAIGYIFARRIHMATQIPIGIVDVSRGGTCVETWTPIDVLKKINTPEVNGVLADWDAKVSAFDPKKDLESRIKGFNDRNAKLKAENKPIPLGQVAPSDLQPGPAADMNRPGNCYAGTLAPLAGLQVKGALWHQGYNNALMPNGAVMYTQVFPEMIKAWRAIFTDPAMSFGIITQETQGQQTMDNFLQDMVDEGNYIREVHYKTYLDAKKAGDKNIGYCSSFDQHRSWFHPQIKVPVGERMARWALATQYGKPVRWLPPQLKEVKPGAGKLVLKMDSDVGPFMDGPIPGIIGFAIAGKDGHFQMAKADYLDKNTDPKGRPNYDRSTLLLSSPLVPEPLYFRYAWARNPVENLASDGLPFDTQRNDTWSLADMYELYTGKKPKVPQVLNGQEHKELIKCMQADDLKRRIFEAKTLLEQNKIKVGN